MNVKARFAYWVFPIDELPPAPSYFILESDVPSLPVYGNVSAEQLTAVGAVVPETPTYEEWLWLVKTKKPGESLEEMPTDK